MTTLDSGPALNVDVATNGRQVGHYTAPLANPLNPMAIHQTPLCVLRTGDGPFVCVLSGTQPGDVTGTTVLQALVAEIGLEQVVGTLVVCPSLLPATSAEPLVSDHYEYLKHSFADDVLSKADVIIEIGSGAPFVETIPHASVWLGEDAERNALAEEIMFASGASDSVRRFDAPLAGSLAAIAEQLDTTFVRFDFGHYNRTDKLSHVRCVSAVRNALLHIGVLKDVRFELNSTRILEVCKHQCRVPAPISGLVHWYVDIGCAVHLGNPIVGIIDPHRPFAEPLTVDARMNGVLLAKLDTAVCTPHQLLAIVGDEVPR